jgi:hypothetical protein
MIDSGAYSAWSRGDTIAVKDYVGFLKRNASVISRYVNLDVIPGTLGRIDWSTEAFEQSATQSYRHQQIIKDAGLSPIPVFHQGERFEWLERMLDDGEAAIGLSPYAKSSTRDTITWLDQCFTTFNGHDVKPHGFGIMQHLIVKRYPWHSIDSSTWWQQPAFGKIVAPIKVGEDYDYAVKPDIVPITEDLLRDPRHFDRRGAITAAAVREYLREVVGIDLAEARYSLMARLRCWTIYYQAFAAWRGIDVVFATQVRTPQQRVLDECGVSSRLLSYYQLTDRALAQYLRGPSAPSRPKRWRSWPEAWRSRNYTDQRKLALYQMIRAYQTTNSRHDIRRGGTGFDIVRRRRPPCGTGANAKQRVPTCPP